MSDKPKKTAEIINPGLGDIEKVRDILFGKYVQSYEQRFAELESKLEKDVESLKQRLLGKMEKAENSLSTLVQSVEDQANQELTEIKMHMQDTYKEFADSVSDLREELSATAKKENKRLDSEKLDREVLALLLDEVSLRLRNQSN